MVYDGRLAGALSASMPHFPLAYGHSARKTKCFIDTGALPRLGISSLPSTYRKEAYHD